MELVQQLGLAPLATHRVLRLLLMLIVLGVMVYGIVETARSTTHEARCQKVLANEHRSDYLTFEIEGCRAQLEAPARFA